jgi:Tfp pilus assembly protein PilF
VVHLVFSGRWRLRSNNKKNKKNKVASTVKCIGGTYLEADDPARAAKYLKKALELEKLALKSSWSMHLSVQLYIDI